MHRQFLRHVNSTVVIITGKNRSTQGAGPRCLPQIAPGQKVRRAKSELEVTVLALPTCILTASLWRSQCIAFCSQGVVIVETHQGCYRDQGQDHAHLQPVHKGCFENIVDRASWSFDCCLLNCLSAVEGKSTALLSAPGDWLASNPTSKHQRTPRVPTFICIHGEVIIADLPIATGQRLS